MRIGDLAKKTGLGVETLRFYEQRGLVLPVERSSSGYRSYDEDALVRLNFIQRAKSLGFSLEEIKQLLELNGQLHQSCHDVRSQVVHKLEEVQNRIRDLQVLQDSLQTLLIACDGSAPMETCPILQSLRS